MSRSRRRHWRLQLGPDGKERPELTTSNSRKGFGKARYQRVSHTDVPPGGGPAIRLWKNERSACETDLAAHLALAALTRAIAARAAWSATTAAAPAHIAAGDIAASPTSLYSLSNQQRSPSLAGERVGYSKDPGESVSVTCRHPRGVKTCWLATKRFIFACTSVSTSVGFAG